MEQSSHIYIAMDLKSFYASVECVDRGLDPLNTNLVVADASRTQKTICLAVSPSLKVYGIPGRARLFEVISKVREVNALRKVRAPGGRFSGKSTFAFTHPKAGSSSETVTTNCYCSKFGISWYSARQGRWKNLKFNIIEC